MAAQRGHGGVIAAPPAGRGAAVRPGPAHAPARRMGAQTPQTPGALRPRGSRRARGAAYGAAAGRTPAGPAAADRSGRGSSQRFTGGGAGVRGCGGAQSRDRRGDLEGQVLNVAGLPLQRSRVRVVTRTSSGGGMCRRGRVWLQACSSAAVAAAVDKTVWIWASWDCRCSTVTGATCGCPLRRSLMNPTMRHRSDKADCGSALAAAGSST